MQRQWHGCSAGVEASPWAILLTAWAALVALSLLTRSFAPIDETRYVSVAWHMWRRGDFLVPWLAGEPYSHKPPLLFWLMHAGWAVFGVNAWWPRLLSPLAALAALALTARLARRLWPDDPGVGLRAAVVLAGTALWVVFTTATLFDMLLTVWVLVGLSGLWQASRGRAGVGWSWVAVAIGAGLLTKGPIVLLHVLLPAGVVLLWQTVTPRRPAPGWRWWVGFAAALCGGVSIALVWALPAGWRGGREYFEAILWGQTAGRMVQAFDHARPWWWYLPLLPLLVLPWSLWPRAWRALASLRRHRGDPGLRLVATWSAAVLVGLSLISGKQVHYLLPVLPAGALVLARLLPMAAAGRRTDVLPMIVVMAGVVAAVLALSLGRLHADAADWLSDVSPWAALVPIAAALVAWGGRGAVPGERDLWRLAGATAVLVGGLQAALFIAAGPALDARELGRRLGELQRAGVPLALTGKEDHGSFDFAGRLQRPLEEVAAADLAAWFEAHPDGMAVRAVDRETYDPRRPAVYRQPWRGEYLVLVSAADHVAWKGTSASAATGTSYGANRVDSP